MKHNKLVRDKIPDYIRSKGQEVRWRTAGEEEYVRKLQEKLQEEVVEFLSGGDIRELVDILEVVEALGVRSGAPWRELLCLKEEKKNERGGFLLRIILEEA